MSSDEITYHFATRREAWDFFHLQEDAGRTAGYPASSPSGWTVRVLA